MDDLFFRKERAFRREELDDLYIASLMSVFIRLAFFISECAVFWFYELERYIGNLFFKLAIGAYMLKKR